MEDGLFGKDDTCLISLARSIRRIYARDEELG
jgi:hypothetical protein